MRLYHAMVLALAVSTLVLAGVEFSANYRFRGKSPDISALGDDLQVLRDEKRRGERLDAELRRACNRERMSTRLYSALIAGDMTLLEGAALLYQFKPRAEWQKLLDDLASVAYGATFEERFCRYLRYTLGYWLPDEADERARVQRRLDVELETALSNAPFLSMSDEKSTSLADP